MPCNLAVSIAKAQVPEKWMRDLLASQIGQELTETFLMTYLEQKYASMNLYKYHYEETLGFILGSFEIEITRGQVQVRSSYLSDDDVKAMSQEVTGLLKQLANRLFQRELKTTLEANLGVPISESEEVVVNDGQTLPATVFTLSL